MRLTRADGFAPRRRTKRTKATKSIFVFFVAFVYLRGIPPSARTGISEQKGRRGEFLFTMASWRGAPTQTRGLRLLRKLPFSPSPVSFRGGCRANKFEAHVVLTAGDQAHADRVIVPGNQRRIGA